MTLSGVTLTGTPSRYCLHLPSKPGGSCFTRVSFFPDNRKSGQLTHLQRNDWSGPIRRCSMLKAPMFCRAMNAAFGDSTDDYAIFPRINIGDPYKRLGISREASEEEIQAARNFLIQRYGGHKPSVDAIESAHDIVIMQKFYERRNPPIDFMKYIRAVTQSRIVQAVRSSFRTPSRSFTIKTFAAFAILGALTVLFPTEDGPTVQVAMSLVATIYFMHDQLKSVWSALFYGTGAFLFSWLFGTFLVASAIPPILKGPRSLEVSTSVISYVLLWVSSTYLRLC